MVQFLKLNFVFATSHRTFIDKNVFSSRFSVSLHILSSRQVPYQNISFSVVGEIYVVKEFLRLSVVIFIMVFSMSQES